MVRVPRDADGTHALTPTEHRSRLGDIELCWFEWGADRRGKAPTLLLAHATGFHARIWDPVVRRLGERHVVAVDQRGHGRSSGGPVAHWGVFGEDLLRLVEHLELDSVLAVGHSMGGHALTQAIANIAKRNNISLLQLKETLEADGVSFGLFREQLREDILINRLKQKEVLGGYDPAFALFAGLNALSLVLLLFVRREGVSFDGARRTA